MTSKAKVFILSWILLTIGVLVPNFAFAEGFSCSDIFVKSNVSSFRGETETVFGQAVSFLRVDSNSLNMRKISSALLDNDKAIFIGIAENSHMYIVAGRYRYDGDFLISEPSISYSEKLSEGVVIRLEDSDGSLKKSLVEYFNAGNRPRSVDCVSGVCSIISRVSQMKVNESTLRTLFPQVFLRKVLQHGFTKPNGEEIGVQLLVVGDERIEDLVRKMQTRSLVEIAKLAAVLTPFIGFSAGSAHFIH